MVKFISVLIFVYGLMIFITVNNNFNFIKKLDKRIDEIENNLKKEVNQFSGSKK